MPLKRALLIACLLVLPGVVLRVVQSMVYRAATAFILAVAHFGGSGDDSLRSLRRGGLGMKVLTLNNLYAPNIRGGAERSVQLLAEALVRSGVAVTVVSTDEEECDRVEVNGVNVVMLPPANLHWAFGDDSPSSLQRKLWHLVDIYNPIMRNRLAAVMRTERPDVVHTNNLQGISTAAWAAAAAEGVPVLHTLRDYYLSCARSTCFRDGRNCARACLPCMPFSTARRAASRIVEGVVGTSQYILEHHLGRGFFAHAPFRAAICNPTIAAEPAKKCGDTARENYF